MLAGMHRRSGPVIALALILALAIGAFALVVGASRQTETVLGPQITLEEPAGSPAPVASGPGRAASTASPPEGAAHLRRRDLCAVCGLHDGHVPGLGDVPGHGGVDGGGHGVDGVGSGGDPAPAQRRRHGAGSTRGRTLRAGAPGL